LHSLWICQGILEEVGCTIQMRSKEHMHYLATVPTGHVCCGLVEYWSIEKGHDISFKDTRVWAGITGYMWKRPLRSGCIPQT
jgi:hypothetical protein